MCGYIILHLFIAYVRVFVLPRVLLGTLLAPKMISGVGNDSNDRVRGLQDDLKPSKEKSKISPSERLRKSQPELQAYPLSLSPACACFIYTYPYILYVSWTLNRFSLCTKTSHNEETICVQGVKTFLLSLWKTLPAVIRWGEIL